MKQAGVGLQAEEREEGGEGRCGWRYPGFQAQEEQPHVGQFAGYRLHSGR